MTRLMLLIAVVTTAACTIDDAGDLELGEQTSAVAGTDTLFAGEQLDPEQAISSGATQLKYQADGNLVLYQNGAPLWATNCWPNCVDVGTANRFVMQTDCNAVVYNTQTYVWHAGTYGLGSNCYARVIEGDWFVCSGSNRVFSARGGGSCAAAPPPPPPAPTGGYVGCFTDDGNRALPDWETGSYSIQACNDRCRALGYAYSGSQWYDQCFCGNSVGYSQVGDGECNTACYAGGGYCGGGWRNSIYATGAAPSEGPTSRNMNRLFDSWVAANGGAPSQRCQGWNNLDDTQRMVFRTILHRLSIGRLPDGSAPLDHVTKLYAILGGAGMMNCNTWGGCPGDCGGTDNNRLFMSVDNTLWYTWHWGYGASITDSSGAVWQDSTDLAGPHTPFTSSRQTTYGHPRGQIHYFGGVSGPWDTAVPVHRLGVPQSGWNDPYIVEMDQDYNITHQSNPMCSSYLTDYILDHGFSGPEPFNSAWRPSGC